MAQELKDYNIMDIEAMDDERLEKSSSGKIFVTRVYIKDEVDAVLAEKDKEIAELKAQVHDYAQGMYVVQARAEKEARHQKYKRCLAMAKWCDEVMMSCELRGYAVHRIWANKHQWAMRLKYRWLELAEKFKEAK